MGGAETGLNKTLMKTKNDIISTLVRLERLSMRDSALEHRAACARSNRAAADTWLTFALYHREAARAVPMVLSTGKTSIPPELHAKMDGLIRRMAEGL